MLLTAGQQPNLLSNYYDRIIGDNIQKNADEDFLDRFSIASDCVQYYITVPPVIRNIPIIRRYTKYLHNNLMWTRNYACNLVKERRKEIKNLGIGEKSASNVLNILLPSNGIPNENDKISLTDEEIGDNIVEMFSEGIDSPSNTLAFIIHCVGANPDVERSIIQEIKNVFGDLTDLVITYEDLNKLVYIEAVIKEVLRLRPATLTISRFSAHRDQFDGYEIPSSTQIAINVVGLHRNQNYWNEPENFNPSRFLEDNIGKNYNKNAFMYFGGGLRVCPAKQFAMVQLKMMVVLLYSKYTFEVTTKDPSTNYNVNLQCKELMTRIKHRR
ncbi:8600_t:CDS:2 [Paraglomus brasilianum]|nr:8600_t:CDS:2 [Paraglomus brasilianum]